MPIYEYKCQCCDFVHEILLKNMQIYEQKCPRCQAEMKKIISMNSFRLKGNGWYMTDFKDNPKNKAKTTKSSS